MSIGSGLPSIPGYAVQRELGRGGMGVVYLAQDERLGRSVAIKALPAELGEDPERLARFRREARVLASLSHASIAAVYGLVEAEGHTYLVMEYVEGGTLAERLSRGPLPVDKALSVCALIAAGVESAHEAGVIHRDLKPGNVMVGEDGGGGGVGAVKVLDFGLARPVRNGRAIGSDVATAPSAPVTEEGVVLGTPGYMSPEQARGRAVDKRTDMFALGTIIYECLAGQRAFGGPTPTDAVAAVLEREPEWQALPEKTPWRVRELLKHCLEKDPARRLRDAGDARLVLETAIAGREWTSGAMMGAPLARPSVGRRARAVLPWGAALAGLGAAGWLALEPGRGGSASREVVRFPVPIPPPMAPEQDEGYMLRLAVSPDGKRVVISGKDGDREQLFSRRLDGLDLQPIAGTEGGVLPLFSPDGSRLAFFTTSGELRVVPAEGGTPITLCSAVARGASWGDDGVIYYADGVAEHRGILGVDLSGAPPRRITTPVQSETVLGHRQPCALPGGRGLLYIAYNGGAYSDCRIMALKPGGREDHVVVERAFCPAYLPTGHLLFGREEGLFIAEFDLETLTVRGQPQPVLPGALVDHGAIGVTHLAWSPGGTLAYLAAPFRLPMATLKWVDPDGKTEPMGDWAEPKNFKLSRDGRLLGIAAASPIKSVWIVDLERGVRMRMTTGTRAWFRDFSPDAQAYFYEEIAPNGFNIKRAWVDRRSAPVKLANVSANVQGGACSPDGRTLLVSYIARPNDSDIVSIAVDAPGEPKPFLTTPADERGASFSPDGRWVVYLANETGAQEVYIRSSGDKAGRVRVSTGSAHVPVWSPDGTTVYYWSREGAFTATAVTTTPDAVTVGASRVLFTADETNDLDPQEQFAVAPDGKRFLMQGKMRFPEPPKEAVVVLNWFEELKAKADAPGR